MAKPKLGYMLGKWLLRFIDGTNAWIEVNTYAQAKFLNDNRTTLNIIGWEHEDFVAK